MNTSTRRPLVVLAAGALLALVGCQRDPIAPTSDPALQAHYGRGNGRNNNWNDGNRGHGRWRFNSDKYKDNGSRPTTGTAGIASVQAEALIGERGVTILEVYSFRASNIDRPDGDIDRLTVRAFAPNGRLLGSRSYRDGRVRSAFVDSWSGMAPGGWFTLEAVVSGLDRRRVDIVPVGPVPVKRRPDLAVTSIGAPSVIVAGTPTVITAGVAELKGDRGARTDCALSVNGQRVDRAEGIWVDAGDVVSCAFTYTFAAAGSYRLRVALGDVTPVDQNSRNNVAELAVTAIVAPPAPVQNGAPVTADFNASVRSGSFTSLDSGLSRWNVTGSGFLLFDSRYANSASGVEQRAVMSGILNTALSFPLTKIELKQATGGVLIDAQSYDNVDADFAGSNCASRSAPGGVSFFLCSHPAGFTAWTYVRNAGSVTYQSSNYSNVWNGASYDVDTYTDNSTDDAGPTVVLGNAFGFDVRLTDGADYYITAALVPLAVANESQVTPWQCASGTTPLVMGGTADTFSCAYSSYVFTGVAGAVQGSGVIAQPGARVTP